MKTKLLLAAMLLIGTITFTTAQRGHGHHTSYSYNDNSYGNNHYASNRNHTGYYDRYLNRMNRSDRKSLKRLLRKLDERKRCAWEDGYVSRREARRISDVKRDIDRLLYRYRRTDRYSYTGYNNYRGGCR